MFGFKKSLNGEQRYEIVAIAVIHFQAVREVDGNYVDVEGRKVPVVDFAMDQTIPALISSAASGLGLKISDSERDVLVKTAINLLTNEPKAVAAIVQQGRATYDRLIATARANRGAT
jgi:hypothetical protein